ncbi:thiamine ABC transporter ATP-binding protein [Aureimonas glaciei]|uniref:Thiamine import ATP-binding protein ThiQ n=1 Tax=Aureimonas glaciei TaxID=1776957 RepID=A0A916YC60_9HYPH|nr:ATP-binding cassette domain-containing protein [Aureimonas glaciei]GGD38415.1 thiamine import ATP-binding protein ThiQ [Aureimonas glaciei]
MTAAALRLNGVVTRYGDLVMRFDLEVAAGEFLAVIGPSGAGKSTLLDLAAGFLQPEAGRVHMAGRDVTDLSPADRPLSVVFQDNNLFADLDVFRNVALGLSPRRRVAPDDAERVREVLAAVGLAGFERRRPADMSGGERQRVTLARAFLRDRPLLLLDEPFAALGPALRREMLELIQALRHRRGAGMGIVMVTHQPEDARGFADRIAFLDAGRIAAIGPTEAMLETAGHAGLSAYLGT